MHTTGRAWRGPSGLVLMRLVDSSVCSTCRLPPTKVYCLCSSTWIVEKPQRKPRSQGTAQALQHGWPVALSPGSPHASLLELPPIFFLHTCFIPSCQKLGNRSDGSSSQCPTAGVCAHPLLRPPPLSGGGSFLLLAAPPHCLLIHPVLFHQPGTSFPYPFPLLRHQLLPAVPSLHP